MSGLDKMKARILEEAQQSAAEILDKAEKDSEAVLASAREAAERRAAKIGKQAEREAAEYEKRAEASMDMRRKQAHLKTKQEVIREVIQTAYEKVLNLDAEAYFSLLGKMLDKYVLPGEGVICFSKRDLERMPGEFEGKIKTAAAAKGVSLVLSQKPAEIDGGFLLVYGGMEENCGIKAVFDSVKDELSDQVNRLLFR